MNTLHGVAEYQTDGDVILGTFYVVDTSDNKWHPERVRVGTVRLLRGTSVLSQRNFDARFGNSDGAFHIDFAHPTVRDNLTMDVSITLTDSSTLAVRVPVVPYTDANRPPLASQPEVVHNQYGLIKG